MNRGSARSHADGLPVRLWTRRNGAIQRRLTSRHGVLLVPKRVLIGFLTTCGATLDTIHLSRRRHDLMTDAIWSVIRPAFGP